MPTDTLTSYPCPICPWVYLSAAPVEEADTAVAIHLDLKHSPIEILQAIRASQRLDAVRSVLRVPIDIDDDDTELHWLD